MKNGSPINEISSIRAKVGSHEKEDIIEEEEYEEEKDAENSTH